LFLVYLFVESYDIMKMRFIPAILTGKGVKDVEYLFMFLVSVSANIVGHVVCKWLDRHSDDRKPD
ncbi:hypothetical protein, partial [Faecalibacterium prausnitzii]|jgi:hypothetical protein|uniref:hypothetical protein n=1 Tax=Faecalibacterium prausnitzii TaxID=853 RepID=UPI001AD834C7